MTDNAGRAPEEWRNFSDKVPLAAIVLRKGDLKKLYKIINDKQIAFRDKLLPFLAQQPTETAEDFSARRKRVHDSFVTSMTIHRTNGESLYGNNEQFLDETNLPDQVRSILFTTTAVPQTLGIAPVSRIILFLDFTRPPVFDFSRIPSLPTPNESNFEIASDDEALFAATRARFIDFFKERQTRVNWLHGGGIYDLALYLVGIPFSMWAVYRASGLLNKFQAFPMILDAAIYVYIFFLGINLFRLFFSYSRWVFPKIELESERSSPLRHRAVWTAITLALLSGIVIPDALKFIF